MGGVKPGQMIKSTRPSCLIDGHQIHFFLEFNGFIQGPCHTPTNPAVTIDCYIVFHALPLGVVVIIFSMMVYHKPDHNLTPYNS